MYDSWQNNRYYKGETMTIRFRFRPGSTPIREARFVRFTIHDPTGHDYPLPLVPIGGGRPGITTFFIPPSFASGQKRLEAFLVDENGQPFGPRAGWTAFDVHDNHSQIDFIRPARGSRLSGTTVEVRYRMRRRIAPCTIHFKVRRQSTGEEIGEVTRQYRPSPPDREKPTYSFVLPASMHLTADGDEYEIVASSTPEPLVDPSSTTFRLIQPLPSFQPLHELGDEEDTAPWNLEVLSPHSGIAEIWSPGSRQMIAWRLRGNYPETRNFRVILRKDDASEWLVISTRDLEWRQRDATYLLPWQVPDGLSGTYRIVITETVSGRWVTSARFAITEEPRSETRSISFVSPRAGTVVHNDSRFTIRWHAEGFPAASAPYDRSKTITIALKGPLGTDQCRMETIALHIPAGRGRFEWEVSSPRVFDWENLGDGHFEGSGLWGGFMGDVPYFYTPGNYRLYIIYYPDHMVTRSETFRIE